VFKTIHDAKPGIEQITLAQKAFGKSGADLLPFIQQMDGDLPALIKKMDELGLTISDNAAAAADDFGDQLDLVRTQLGRVGITIGQAFMPVFLKMANGISDWVGKNQAEIVSWADKFAFAFDKIIKGAGVVITALENYYRNYKGFMEGIGLGFLVPKPFLLDALTADFNAANKGKPTEGGSRGAFIPSGGPDTTPDGRMRESTPNNSKH
jgi:hypothetical protein